ncbi:hypothetical protein DsansV1_C29g0211431 [Dioscorea sansibarensis]
MKASVKLREEQGKPPLLRFKLPIRVFSLPFTSAVSVSSSSAPSDVSFDLKSALPFGPSLKLSYRPSPSDPFSLSLSSGIGVLGSPLDSPLVLSARFSPLAPVSFSLTLKPRLGDFSLKSTAISNPNASPNPKENGGGVYHPIPVPPRVRTGLEDLLASGVVAVARTSIPVGRRAAVRLRWGVNMPKPESVGWGRLPYLTVDKISIEAGERNENEEEKKKKIKEKNDLDANATSGMVYWMGREVEELQKENRMIKENVEELKKKVFERKVGKVEPFMGDLDVKRKNTSAAIAKEIEKETKKKPFVARFYYFD